MKELSGQRGWEHAYRKEMEDRLARARKHLEMGEGRELAEFQYLCGKICGIREAIELMIEKQNDYRLDDDSDLAS